MRFPLPPAAPAALRAAVTTPAGLRRWWDPDAQVRGDRLSPGLDAPEMSVASDGDVVTWTGALLEARFDLAGGAVTVTSREPLDAADRDELALAWQVALTTLRWALGHGDVAWRRLELPVALAYTDAWSRIAGEEGLAGTAEVPIRIASQRVVARRLLVLPPRAVILDLGDALLRVAFGPGDSVNAAHVDLLATTPDPNVPPGWDGWLARRLGMTWVAQLGEEG